VRILLDENVPSELSEALPGHDVWTVTRRRWSGTKNGALLRRAASEFDAFITLDRSIQHQQVLPPTLIFITLRPNGNLPANVVELAPQILEALATAGPGKPITVLASD
jgi:hypothetical protein